VDKSEKKHWLPNAVLVVLRQRNGVKPRELSIVATLTGHPKLIRKNAKVQQGFCSGLM